LSEIGLLSSSPWSSTKRDGPLSEIEISSSPTCPLPRGVVFCPKLDFYPHPLGPLPRGMVHCPRSDFPHHPPVLYREGWSFVRNWTFILIPLVLYQEGWSIVRDRTFLITPLSSTERGGLLWTDFLLSKFPVSLEPSEVRDVGIPASSNKRCPQPGLSYLSHYIIEISRD
jgi:hypothetical protein